MIEIPESMTITRELNETIKGKKIVGVVTNHSPHKFAFFYEDPKDYSDLLKGKSIYEVNSYGGQVVIIAKTKNVKTESTEIEDPKTDDEDVLISLSDDAQIRYIATDEDIPEKNQLLITFEDDSSLVASARMYAQLHVARVNEYDSEYYEAAKVKPSPISDDFDMKYFKSLLDEVRPTTSVKAFLATKQRIPGLGNGTLQDILYNAKIHPKSKVKKLSNKQIEDLFNSVKNTLKAMTEKGGRNTEKDIFGNFGGYEVILSPKTFKNQCPCGGKINKESYLGGTIYYCLNCQKLEV